MNADELAVDGRLYPCMQKVEPRVVIHLGRAEARKGRLPALFAICPGGVRLGELDPVPTTITPRWWRRASMWCPQCKSYLVHRRRGARAAHPLTVPGRSSVSALPGAS